VGRSDKNLTKTSPPSKKQITGLFFSNPALLENHVFWLIAIPKKLKKAKIFDFHIAVVIL